MPGKGVELPLPEASVAGDPQGGVLHGSGNQTAAAEPAVLRSGEQSRVLQHAQVFRNRGERYVEGLGQLGDRRLSPRQAREDRPAGWVRQRGKCRVEAAVRIVNHMVKYCRVIASCQARNARRVEAECQPGPWIAAGGESPWEPRPTRMALDTSKRGGYGPGAWEFEVRTRLCRSASDRPWERTGGRCPPRPPASWNDFRMADARNRRDHGRG